jgi:hypothetical protein
VTTRSRAKLVLEAHAARSATAVALLLHARGRGAKEMRSPFGALIGSLLLAVVMVVAVVVGHRIGVLIGRH